MGSSDGFEVVPGRFEHGGDRVLATVTFRGSGERGDFEFSGAQVFTIRDGRIAEVHEFRQPARGEETARLDRRDGEEGGGLVYTRRLLRTVRATR